MFSFPTLLSLIFTLSVLMFKFLKSNNPLYFLFISSFILFFSVINHILLSSQEIIWPFSSVINLNKYFFYFAYTAILLFSAIKTNIIINKSVFFQKTNYATGLIYIAIASSIYPLHLSIKPLLANLFCLLALENLLKIYRNKTCKIEIFNASCWLLTSALFVGNTIFIFPSSKQNNSFRRYCKKVSAKKSDVKIQ